MILNYSQFHSQQSTFSSPSQQFLGILLSSLPFTRNLPSIRHTNSLCHCLGTTDLLVGLVIHPLYAPYWMSVVYEHWSYCRPLLLHHNYTIWSGNLSRLVPKDFPCFRSSSGSNTRSCSTKAEPTKCTENGAI